VTKISKKKPGARKPGNPFLDATFNLNRFANEKGMRPDDIAERTGIPTNEHIEIQTIEGMTFLKLDDTPDEYTVSKYLRVNEDADAIIFDDLDVEVFWAKGSECIYYKDRNVAVGKTTADYTFDVEGTVRATTALLSDAHVTAGSYVKADTYVDATTYYKFGGNNLLWIEDDNNIILGEDILGGDNLSGVNFSGSFLGGYKAAWNAEWSLSSVVIGAYAGYHGSGLTRCVFLGHYAGDGEAAATNNDYTNTIAIGWRARQEGSGDTSGVYIGNSAGRFLGYGQDRICIGRSAGRGRATDPTGYLNSTYSYGIFIGSSAGGSGAANITGDDDVGIGRNALHSVTSSAHSIALGRNSLYQVTEGSGNIGIGGYAGNTLTTGTYNILLGYDADTDGVDYTNSIGIAYQAAVTKSNQIVLGNSSHTEFKMPMFGAGSLQSDADGVVTASGSLGLGDPGADRIAFWDDSESCLAWLTPGTGLSITTTNLNVDVGIANDKIVQVDQGAGLTDDQMVRATANGIESISDADLLAQLSGDAGAAFDWNDQDLLKVNSLAGKEISTPANPSAGYNKLYSKSDDKWYTLDSDGNETELGSGGGASAFTDLTDVPASYSGEGGSLVAVNDAETDLEFITNDAVTSLWGRVMIDEDFESVSTGDIDTQGSYPNFDAFSVTADASCTAEVVDDSGNQILRLSDSNASGHVEAQIDVSDREPTKFYCSFKMRINSTSLSGLVIFTHANANWWQFYFRGADSTINYYDGTRQSLTAFSADTWYEVEILVDTQTASEQISMWVDGAYEYSEAGPNVGGFPLASIKFETVDADDGVVFDIDDFKVIDLSRPYSGTLQGVEFDNIKIKDGGELRLYDVGDSNYVGFEAPALTANQIWVLPDADTAGPGCLKSDGSGNLGWTSAVTGISWGDNFTIGTSGTGLIGYYANFGASMAATIGSGKTYSDWADMLSSAPSFFNGNSTITIGTGETLSEHCEWKYRHGMGDYTFTIEAEDYFPQSGAIPTASSATATTLVDSTQAWAVDRFIDCWVLIVDGTGTDNGFVAITDSDATSVTVASWPGTQPDNTSRYIIVGALIDGGNSRNYGMSIEGCTIPVLVNGIGFKDCTTSGLISQFGAYTYLSYCGFYNCDKSGVRFTSAYRSILQYSGVVNCNTDNGTNDGGCRIDGINYASVVGCAFSDNNRRGILVERGHAAINNNFGDGNGTWGTYAQNNGFASAGGTECSGSSGNHSDAGTAGSNSADQAVVY